MRRSFLVCLAFLIVLYAVPLSAQEVERLKAGVVRVSATTLEGKKKVGTGFIVRLEADAVYIVTASHVLGGDKNPKVEFFTRKDRPIPATVVKSEGGDPQGLALLLVEEKMPSGLSVLGLNSSISVRERDPVITIGFPRIAGVPWAPLDGKIVGPRGKAIVFSGAAAEEGNSGGPLIKDGQVIGVVTEVSKPFAYAVPAVIAQVTLEGWGVKFEELAAAPPPPKQKPEEPSPIPTGIWQELRALETHSDFVNGVAWSPGGRKLASGVHDAQVRVWDTVSGRELQVLGTRIANQPVSSVAWSRDGRRLASGGVDNIVRVWDARNGTLLRLLTGHTKAGYRGVSGVTWSRDGTRLASAGDDGTVRVWEVETGRQLRVLRLNRDNVWSVVWSPDGTKLAAGGGDFQSGVAVNGKVIAWDVSTWQAMHVMEGYKGAVTSVAWSPDGARLAFVHFVGGSGSVRLWDLVTNLQLWAGGSGTFWSVAWSSDGTRLATGDSFGRARIWNAATGEQLREYRTPYGQVYSVDWSPDSDKIALGHGGWREKGKYAMVRIWGSPNS